MRRAQSGQALVEFAFIALIMLVLAFGLIDLSRAIYQKQIMTNLTREGSNLAARKASTEETALQQAANAVMQGAAPLTIDTRGRVIVTAVKNTGGTCRLVTQVSLGGLLAASRMGRMHNDKVNAIPCADSAGSIPQPGQTIFVTEVFYQYEPITPLGRLIRVAVPSPLYDVAYF